MQPCRLLCCVVVVVPNELVTETGNEGSLLGRRKGLIYALTTPPASRPSCSVYLVYFPHCAALARPLDCCHADCLTARIPAMLRCCQRPCLLLTRSFKESAPCLSRGGIHGGARAGHSLEPLASHRVARGSVARHRGAMVLCPVGRRGPIARSRAVCGERTSAAWARAWPLYTTTARHRGGVVVDRPGLGFV